jgi:hypothetical protein
MLHLINTLLMTFLHLESVYRVYKNTYMICRCEVKYAATLQEKQGKDNNTIRLFYFVKLIRYMHCKPTGKTKIWVCYTFSAENVEKIILENQKRC